MAVGAVPRLNRRPPASRASRSDRGRAARSLFWRGSPGQHHRPQGANAMRSNNPTANSLARDTQNVVSEAQELLKTVKEDGMNKMDQVRSQVSTQLEGAREKFGEIQSTVQEGAKVAY